MHKKIAIILSFCACIAFHNISFANQQKSVVPTKVSADAMNYDSANNLVTFAGDVAIEREEFRLWADTITIYLKSDEASNDPMVSLQSGEIHRIIAENNVRMQYDTNTGSCGKAIYEADKALLIMQENPILKEGDNSLTGEEIRYYMEENRSEVIGGSKRVEAIFSSEGELNF